MKLNPNVQTLDLIGGEEAIPTELPAIAPTLRERDGTLVAESPRRKAELMRNATREAQAKAAKKQAAALGNGADKAFNSRMEIAFATCPGGSQLVSQLKG